MLTGATGSFTTSLTGSDGNLIISVGTTGTIRSTGSCVVSYLSATGGDITGLTVRTNGRNLLGSLSVNGTEQNLIILLMCHRQLIF